jgi:hypothetical protein
MKEQSGELPYTGPLQPRSQIGAFPTN